MPTTIRAIDRKPAEAGDEPPWLTAALAPYRSDWRGPVSVRRHEPDSPESIYLREQAVRNGTWKEPT